MTTTNVSQVQNQQRGGACCTSSHEEVARAAFGIYEKSGSQHGHCERNWLAAEQQLAAHHAATAHGHPVAGKSISAVR